MAEQKRGLKYRQTAGKSLIAPAQLAGGSRGQRHSLQASFPLGATVAAGFAATDWWAQLCQASRQLCVKTTFSLCNFQGYYYDYYYYLFCAVFVHLPGTVNHHHITARSLN